MFSLFSLECLERGLLKQDVQVRIHSPAFDTIGFFSCSINHTPLTLVYCFPRLLISRIRCFIPCAILWVSRYSSMHLRTWNRPGCSLFCVRMIYSALLMLKVTPQFRHFASTLPGLGPDDTILKNPHSISYSQVIIKSGKASLQCMPVMVSA